MKHLILLFILLVIHTQSIGQSKVENNTSTRPKIGLVLSGGGAKGFAHIGAIKLLEEAGIKPDFVTGTSMGSVVGALYAMGYSVEEMIAITDTTDWDFVLSNTVELSRITMVEKQYYGSFLTELDITKKGVNLPGGLIEGQNLSELLSSLTHPVHGIDNFLDFPIPYTCVATDIVEGVPVSLNQGNISDAIRASMAIPSIFTPVEYDSLLLIDGGWTRNLPVQEARDMGADIIISVDVGAPLLERGELKSMLSILDQTAWILSTQDTKNQRELSDYIISPPVSDFVSLDFSKADTIIKLGYESALQQKDVFEKLAKRVYGKNGYEKLERRKPITNYNIAKVEVNGNIKTSDKFVEGRLNLKKGKTYSASQINDKVGLLYGTVYFKKVGYQIVSESDSTQKLIINVVEDNPAKLKLSIYYDNENSFGLNANLTVRNIVLKNSRLIFDAFISENPIFGLKYIKYTGQNQHSFFFTDIKYTKDSRYQWQNLYLQEAGFNYREVLSNVGFAFTHNHNVLVGTSIGFQGARANPTTNQDTIVKSWSQSAFPIKAFLHGNSLNKSVFPSKGMQFIGEISYNLDVHHKATLKSGFNGFSQSVADDLVKVDPYFTFRLGYKHYVPLAKKFSLFFDARLIMPSTGKVGFNDFVQVGGISPILFSSMPFWGATRNELNVEQVAGASLGFQWNVYGNIYFKGKANYLNTQYPMVWLNEVDDVNFEIDGKTYNSMFGFGAELAYNSAIGPLRLILHQHQYSNQLHVFVAVGFNIYKSEGDF